MASPFSAWNSYTSLSNFLSELYYLAMVLRTETFACFGLIIINKMEIIARVQAMINGVWAEMDSPRYPDNTGATAAPIQRMQL